MGLSAHAISLAGKHYDEITVESIESLRGYIETNNIEPDAQPDPWQELENQRLTVSLDLNFEMEA